MKVKILNLLRYFMKVKILNLLRIIIIVVNDSYYIRVNSKSWSSDFLVISLTIIVTAIC